MRRHDNVGAHERFTRPLLAQCGVRLIIGKGGLGADSLAAFGEIGGAYLAIVGGTRRWKRPGSRRSKTSISTI